MENPNSSWINLRGTWITHFILVAFFQLVFTMIPGVDRETSWTMTNISYHVVTFIFFHWLTGTPFDTDQGAYMGQTLWEQIDEGSQFTPAKKFLTAFPIGLFLISVHYTHYDLTTFWVNFTFLIIGLVPKLPAAHGVRIGGINRKET